MPLVQMCACEPTHTLQPHALPSALPLLAPHLLPSTGLALLCTSFKGLVVLTGIFVFHVHLISNPGV